MRRKLKFNSFLILPVFFASSFAAFPFSCSLSATRDGGIFKSTNNAEQWQQKVAISQKRTIAADNIETITIDPRDSKVIYLGTRADGLYKSSDGGEAWYPLSNPGAILNNLANVYDIAVDPQNTANVYVATYQDRFGRLFRSSDAGKNWEEVYRVSREQYAVFAVEVDHDFPAIIYMGTAEGGLLKSTDYGKSWKIINWFNGVVTALKINPQNSNEVYVSTYNDGIYKTIDKGQTWNKIQGVNGFLESTGIETLVMCDRSPNVLYTGSKTGLLRSSDSGISWNRVPIVIPPDAVPIRAVAIDPSNPSVIYYSAGNIVYRSIDSGQSWSLHPIGTSRYIKVIIIDRSSSNILYAGMSNE